MRFRPPFLLLVAALLVAPALAAGAAPLPEPLPDRHPTDATGYGVGTASLHAEWCGGVYSLELDLYNQTASRGFWTLNFFLYHDPEMLPVHCTLKSSNGSHNGTFDPKVGGCFGNNATWETSYVCLEAFPEHVGNTFPEFPGQSYKMRLEEARYGRNYHGTARVVFADPAVPNS